MSKGFSWYSNKNLGWIWGRSFAVSFIAGAMVYTLLSEVSGSTVAVAALVPLLIGVVNTFAYFDFKKNNGTNEKI